MMKHTADASTGEVGPGQEVWLRCGTRQISACPPCAALYRGDARAIIFEGLRTALDHGEQLVFLTLTAPSFGETHRVPPTPSPRLNRRQRAAWEKRYLRACPCGTQHAPGDRRFIGVPLRPSLYDYDGQVRWNSEAGRLWSRTADEIRRRLDLDTLPYIGTTEWQARGAVHLHLILRLSADTDLGLIEDRARGQRSEVIEQACAASATFTGPNRTGTRLAWGRQCVAELVQAERQAFRTAGYLAKLVGYAVKDLGTSDDGSPPAAMMQIHHRRLTEAARAMTCGQPGGEQHSECRYRQTGESEGVPVVNARRSRCRSLRHRQWGWRGHVLRRSRSWSTLTMGQCRARRAEFGRLQREAENPTLLEDDDLTIWLRPQDGMPMQVEEHAWPRIRDGRLAELRASVLLT